MYGLPPLAGEMPKARVRGNRGQRGGASWPITVICGSTTTVPFAKRRGRGSEVNAEDARGGRAGRRPTPYCNGE